MSLIEMPNPEKHPLCTHLVMFYKNDFSEKYYYTLGLSPFDNKQIVIYEINRELEVKVIGSAKKDIFETLLYNKRAKGKKLRRTKWSTSY